MNLARVSLEQTIHPPACAGGWFTKSMRYNFPPTASLTQAGKDYAITTVWGLPSPTRDLWVETWIQFSANWTTNGPASGNQDYKTLFFHNGQTEVRLTTGPTVAMGYGGNSWYNIGSLSTYTNASWNGFRFHIKTTSPGTIEVWHNVNCGGWQKVNLQPQGGAEPLSALNMSDRGPTSYLMIGGNLNRGSPHDQFVLWGGFRAFNSNPGW